MSILRIYPYFSVEDEPKTGLALADIRIDILRVKKSDGTFDQAATNAHPQSEIGGGHYGYSLPNVDYTVYDYIPHGYYTGAIEVDSPRLFAPEYQQEDVSAKIATGGDLAEQTRTLLKEVTAVEWSDLEISFFVGKALVEVSAYSPYETMATMATVAGSRDVDISSIANLQKIIAVEYPIGNWPKDYRNFKVRGTTVTMDITTAPSASDEDVNVYYGKTHTESTIDDRIRMWVAEGAAAYAALQWCNNARLNIKGATEKFSLATDEIEQAIEDLDSGRVYINTLSVGHDPEGEYSAYARTGLENAKGYLQKINSRLSTATAIRGYENWANNKLAMFKTEIRKLGRQRTQQSWPKD